MLFSDFVEINPRVAIQKEKDYPFIEMDVVTPGQRYVQPNNKRIYTGGGTKFQAGDTLFARITPCLENGKIAQFKAPVDTAAFGSTEFFIFRAREGISDPAYIFYLASSDIIRKPAEKSMSGASGRQRADLASIKDLLIPAPPLPTQRRIAAVLSAYDDLIENNTRRIAILEEMARTLYREWFVHFRFPGHENVEIINGLPKGWERLTIRDVTSYINRGISPKYDDNSTMVVINQKCVRDEQVNLALARRHTSKVLQEKLVQFGDVLINSTGIGTLGRVAQFYQQPKNYTVDSHVSIVRPNKNVNIDYFGSFLSTLQDHFDSQGIGSTGQTELGREAIAKTQFVVPSPQLQEKFSQFVAPTKHLAMSLSKKNTNLRRQRDLLLPRLVSGELDVSELEIV